jgi:DNA repair protein RecO (recombination protein O)
VIKKSQGIVIRLVKLTETSLIVRWLTSNEGIISTVAKGARRPNSIFQGKIDLFFHAEIIWERARQGDLHSLRESLVVDYQEGLRKNYETALLAGYFTGLIEKISEPEHPEPEIYDLLCRALKHVTEKTPTLLAMRHFEKQLAKIHGIGSDENYYEWLSLKEIGGDLTHVRKELERRIN